MHELLADLLAHGPVVTDGAWGTQLQARGLALGEHDPAIAGRATEINRCGVQISRRGASDRAKVFGSIGPTGKLLLSGDVTLDTVTAAFVGQAQALAAAGADALLVESMGDIEEAKLAVAAAKATGLPVVASMVYDSGQHRDRTMMGTTAAEFAKHVTALIEAGASLIGGCCGTSPEFIREIAARLLEPGR